MSKVIQLKIKTRFCTRVGAYVVLKVKIHVFLSSALYVVELSASWYQTKGL